MRIINTHKTSAGDDDLGTASEHETVIEIGAGEGDDIDIDGRTGRITFSWNENTTNSHTVEIKVERRSAQTTAEALRELLTSMLAHLDEQDTL